MKKPTTKPAPRPAPEPEPDEDLGPAHRCCCCGTRLERDGDDWECPVCPGSCDAPIQWWE
jgi:hypothetical protein